MPVSAFAEAVRKLYGDKVPAPDDNLLGWVPGIQDQLALAEAHGGDVEVPLADWVAKVEPEVAKELHDDLRVRPGGMTINEIGEQKPVQLEEPKPEATQAEPVEIAPEMQPIIALRQASKLDPILPAAELDQPLSARAQSLGIIPDNAVNTTLKADDKVYPTKHFLATDAFKMIDKDHLTGVPRALAEFFHDRFDRMAGDTPIVAVDPAVQRAINKRFNIGHDAPAFYSPDDNAIVMREDIADGRTARHSTAAHILIHETVHAATYHALKEFPEINSAVESLMGEADKYLTEKSPEDRELHNYAFKNTDEFVAETFSNPHFQEVLSLTPLSSELAERLGLPGKSSSVWDAVKQIISGIIERLIGKAPPPTVMDGMMRIGEAIEELQISH